MNFYRVNIAILSYVHSCGRQVEKVFNKCFLSLKYFCHTFPLLIVVLDFVAQLLIAIVDLKTEP